MSIESLKNKKDLNKDEILLLMKNEKDVKVYEKLNFIKFLKEDYPIKEAYYLANIKKSSAYLTLTQWKEEGYKALLRKPGGGRKTKLNENQIKILKTKIQSNAFDCELEIQNYIKNEWDIEYTIDGIKNLIKTKFNTTLNENNETLNDIIVKLIPHLKEIENNENKKDTEFINLKLFISREKNSEVLKKLLYLLLRKLGFSNKFTSEIFNITPATGNNWIKKWKKQGYNGLIRKKGQGRKSKLTNKELETLKKTK